MSEMKIVGQVVANSAHMLLSDLINDDTLPGINTRDKALTAIASVVKQSPAWRSERVWAAVFAGLTAALAVPEVHTLLGPWAPVVTACVSAALAVWSKLGDPRPTR
jgi:hypothetical protein